MGDVDPDVARGLSVAQVAEAALFDEVVVDLLPGDLVVALADLILGGVGGAAGVAETSERAALRAGPLVLIAAATACERLAVVVSTAVADPVLHPIGIIRSTLRSRADAPKQGVEGAPDAWLEVEASVAPGLEGLAVGAEIIVITWLHAARRDVLAVHPRDDLSRPLAGVFTTRSQDRPNPLGLHRVTVREVDGVRLRIGPIEAFDETPVIDIKPVLAASRDS